MAKILVIDDELDIRQVVSRILSAKGHQAVAVADGMFAIKAIREERPDLIILDILMPGLDGCALGYHLKRDSEFSSIPIMVLSSLGDKSYLGDEMAADYFMPKPFNAEALVKKVEELLGSGRVRVGAVENENPSPKRKWRPLFISLSAIFFAILIAGALLLFRLNSADFAVGAPPDAAEAGTTISVTADRLFVYSAPVALGALIYIAFALNRMARREYS